MPSRGAAIVARPLLAIATLLWITIAPGRARAEEPAAGPRLVEVDLGPTVPLTRLLEAGLD
ncbi:MAG: hypothetical protein ACRENJ_10790, partial [Candidatus Eiseniibacteriota bacterium]